MKPFQEEFLSALSSGKDLLYTEETTKNLGQLQNIYTLHAITLLLAKRKEILKHSEKIAKATADGKEPPVCKDQGFSRPSILIVLPMRHSAYLVIESILTLCLRDKIENKTRFLEDFAPTPEELDDDDSKPGTV